MNIAWQLAKHVGTLDQGLATKASFGRMGLFNMVLSLVIFRTSSMRPTFWQVGHLFKEIILYKA